MLDRLRARERQLAAVVQLGRTALAGSEEQSLFQEATVLIADVLEVEMTKVLELLPDRATLLLRAGVGWQDGLVGKETVGAGRDSQAGYSMESSIPIIVEDLNTETRFRGSPLLFDHGVVSGMSVIIGTEADPWGVLGAHTRSARHFTFDDVNFLQSMAIVLSTAIRRQRAEQVIRDREHRLRLVMHAMPVLIAYVDTDLIYRLSNGRFGDWFGISEEEVVGRSIREVIGDAAFLQIEPYTRRALNGERVSFETTLPYQHGPVRDVHVMYMPHHAPNGEVLGYYAMIDDISERKESERELERWADLLEERVAERTAIAEKRAQDLRVLAGEFSRTEQRVRRRLAVAIHDDLQQVLVAAKMRLPMQERAMAPEQLAAVHKLLDEALAKSQALVRELRPPVLQHGTLKDAFDWLARQMNERHDLRVDVRCESEIAVDDEVKTTIFEAVRELLFNVVKHAATRQATLSAAQLGDHVTVTVADQGQGFSPAELRSGAGGFGLRSMDERVAALGGKLEIESAPGAGAQFRLIIPTNSDR